MDEEGVDFADQQKIIERLSDTGYTHFRVPGEVAESRIGNGGKENGTAKQIVEQNTKTKKQHKLFFIISSFVASTYIH